MARSKLLTTVWQIVAHFNAVLVYTLKAMLSLSGDAVVSTKLSEAKQDLSHCVSHVIVDGQATFIWRHQWPAFIAAVESEDRIYAAWLLPKLCNGRYATLLRERIDNLPPTL